MIVWFIPFLGVTAFALLVILMMCMDGVIPDRSDMKTFFFFYLLILGIAYCVFTLIKILNTL